MKNKGLLSVISILVPFALSGFPSLGSAFGLDLRPRVNTGLMHYEFEQEALFRVVERDGASPVFFGPSSKISFSDVMPFVGIGATAFAHNGIYLDLYYQAAFSGSDSDTLYRLNAPTSDTLTRREINRDWDRDEFALTLGYTLTENFAVFAGYKRSSTDFEDVNRQVNIDPNTGVQTSPATTVSGSLEYTQDGPFIGGTYGWRIQKGDWLNGILALNLGLAFIDGEIEQDFGGKTSDIKGDTIGVTLGFGWTGRLVEKAALLPNGLNYTLAIDGYQYNFDADEKSGEGEVQGADFSETVFRFSAGVSVPIDLSF